MFVDKATLIAKNGFMFFGDPGLDFPSDWETANLVNAALGQGTAAWKGWEFLGASSLDDLPEPGKDGGDTDSKGTWDGMINRIVAKSASNDYVTINPTQCDANIMAMHWGRGDYDPTRRVFTVKTVGGQLVEKAFLMIAADGPARLGLHAWKATFTRDKPFKMDGDKFTEWPLRATWTQMAGKPGLIEILGVAPASS